MEPSDGDFLLDCVVIREDEGMIKLDIHEALAVFRTAEFFMKKNCDLDRAADIFKRGV